MRFAPRWALFLLLLAAGCASSLQQQVREAVDQLVATPELRGGRVGVLVVDGNDERELAASMSTYGFAPASNNKLLTSAIALQSLGSEHRMTTALSCDGSVVDGELHGNLYLVGGGDPTFGDARFADQQWSAFADALKQEGVERVRGRLIGDASAQGGPIRGHGWQWDYLADGYAAPFGGLCVADNLLRVRVVPSADGPQVEISPDVGDRAAWITSSVIPDADVAADAVVVRRALGAQQVRVSGSIGNEAAVSSHRVAICDPVAFAEAVGATALRARGVRIDDGEQPRGERRQLAAVSSPTIAEITQRLLTESDNLYAEQLFRVAGNVGTGSASNGKVREHAGRVLAELGVDTRGLVMADGSGLSRRNLVSPRQLSTLLLTVLRSSWREEFLSALPVAGKTGTLRNRFNAGAAHGVVRAKTGFISRVVCLSGYVPRPDGEPLVFSVMLNDFTCATRDAKAAVDRFVQRLATLAAESD